MADPTRKTYTLKEPIKNGSSEFVTEFHIRKPKAGDLRPMPTTGQTVGHQIDLIGRLTGQPDHILNDLSLEDLEGVSSIIDGFTQPGPATGTTSSQ